jgi:ABC-2 type transport system ATP-binding protein
MRLLLLAMAICQDSRVLILDEPTSMIDIISRARIQHLLAGEGNKCILLASHDMNEVRSLCDRIYVIASGRFIAEGTPQEISALVKLPVEIAFVPAVPSGVEELLRAKNISFEKEGPVFHVAFNDLPQGIEFIDDAQRSTGLNYLHLEAPSLERAVLQLLQEAKHE